ncbi:MAG TPA: TIR domain-containing protein [Oceanobacillus sp.]|nr:TIR domain-containing protein [Oceanobacillus sp.]
MSDKTVFISYRRSTSRHLARSIFMDLREHGWDAFFDVNTIDSGAFDHIILNQIGARAHFVLVLSPGALERCVHEDDWLRREIEEAIRLKRNVVPIVEEGFSFERELDYLPPHLHVLSRYNALPLVHYYFDAAMDMLRNRFLKATPDILITPTPEGDLAAVRQRLREAEQNDTPTSADEYLQRGKTRLEAGDHDGAIADATAAIRLNPQLVDAYVQRGLARLARRQWDYAIASFSEAIRIQPQAAAAYAHRGQAREGKGDYRGALADYHKALEYGGANDEVAERIEALERRG